MSHVASRPPAAFKPYPSRLRRWRLPTHGSPAGMGPNAYRIRWMAQNCFAVIIFAVSLGALPSLSPLTGRIATASGLFVALQLIAAGLLLFYGTRRQVSMWPSALLAIVTVAGWIVLPMMWGDTTPSLPSWLLTFLSIAVPLLAVFWGPSLAMLCLGAFLVTALVHAVRMPPDAGLRDDLVNMLMDSAFSVVVVAMIALLLRTAEDADLAYSTALAHATALKRSRSQSDEQERLDRLIHDNVMAALLDASRSEGQLSKRTQELARRALSVLEFEEKRSTGTATTYVHALMDELLEALTPWRSRVRFNFLVHYIRPEGHPPAVLPSDTAQALIHAVTEAVSNSARHSGTETTFVTMDGGNCPPTRLNPEGFFLTFEVMDRGRGFQVRSVDSRRLGVRVSIIGNVENAGGEVEVASVPHRGTQIKIMWPRDAHPPA